MRDTHIASIKAAIEADNKNIFPVDFLAIAATNRAISNIDGFIQSIDTKNFMLSGTLVRLHLDTLLRFFSIHLVKDPHSLARSILAGEKLRKIKDSDNKNMADAYLRKKFIEREPEEDWINGCYEETSGFVHLSEKHIFSTIGIENEDENTIRATIDGSGIDVPTESKIEATQCMAHISKLIIKYIDGWGVTKDAFSDKSLQKRSG